MRRGERGAYLIFGSAFTPVASTLFAGSPSLALREVPIILALTIVAVVANISVLQRLSAITGGAARARGGQRASVPTPAAAAFDDEAMATKPDLPVGTV